MSTGRKELLLAALHRAEDALSTREATESAYALGLSQGWPADQLEELAPKSVVKLLQNMQRQKLVIGGRPKAEDSRVVPTFKPAGERDANYPIPDAPRGLPQASSASAYANRSKTQLIMLLESQDNVLEAVVRFKNDLEAVISRERRKLFDAGIMDSALETAE